MPLSAHCQCQCWQPKQCWQPPLRLLLQQPLRLFSNIPLPALPLRVCTRVRWTYTPYRHGDRASPRSGSDHQLARTNNGARVPAHWQPIRRSARILSRQERCGYFDEGALPNNLRLRRKALTPSPKRPQARAEKIDLDTCQGVDSGVDSEQGGAGRTGHPSGAALHSYVNLNVKPHWQPQSLCPGLRVLSACQLVRRCFAASHGVRVTSALQARQAATAPAAPPPAAARRAIMILDDGTALFCRTRHRRGRCPR